MIDVQKKVFLRGFKSGSYVMQVGINPTGTKIESKGQKKNSKKFFPRAKVRRSGFKIFIELTDAISEKCTEGFNGNIN